MYKKNNHDEAAFAQSVNPRHAQWDFEKTRHHWRKVNNSKPKSTK